MPNFTTLVQISISRDFNPIDIFQTLTLDLPDTNLDSVNLEAYIDDPTKYKIDLFARARFYHPVHEESDFGPIRQFRIENKTWDPASVGLVTRFDLSNYGNIELVNANTVNLVKCSVSDNTLRRISGNEYGTVYSTPFGHPGLSFWDTKIRSMIFNEVEAHTVAMVVNINTRPQPFGEITGYISGNGGMGIHFNNDATKIEVSGANTVANHEIITVNGRFNNSITKNSLSIVTVTIPKSSSVKFNCIGCFGLNDQNKFTRPFSGLIYDILYFKDPLVGLNLEKVIGYLADKWDKAKPGSRLKQKIPNTFPFVSGDYQDELFNPGHLIGNFIIFDPDRVRTTNIHQFTSVKDPYRDDYSWYTGNEGTRPSIENNSITNHAELVLTNNQMMTFTYSLTTGINEYKGPVTYFILESDLSGENGCYPVTLDNCYVNGSSDGPIKIDNGNLYPYSNEIVTSTNQRLHTIYQPGTEYYLPIREKGYIRLNGGNEIELDLPKINPNGLGRRAIIGGRLNDTKRINGKIGYLMIYLGELSKEDEDRIIGWIARDKEILNILPNSHPYKDKVPGFIKSQISPYYNYLGEFTLRDIHSFIIQHGLDNEGNINSYSGNIFKDKKAYLKVVDIENDFTLISTPTRGSAGGYLTLEPNGDYLFRIDNSFNTVAHGKHRTSSWRLKIEDTELKKTQYYNLQIQMIRNALMLSDIEKEFNKVKYFESHEISEVNILGDLTKFSNIKITKIDDEVITNSKEVTKLNNAKFTINTKGQIIFDPTNCLDCKALYPFAPDDTFQTLSFNVKLSVTDGTKHFDINKTFIVRRTKLTQDEIDHITNNITKILEFTNTYSLKLVDYTNPKYSWIKLVSINGHASELGVVSFTVSDPFNGKYKFYYSTPKVEIDLTTGYNDVEWGMTKVNTFTLVFGNKHFNQTFTATFSVIKKRELMSDELKDRINTLISKDQFVQSTSSIITLDNIPDYYSFSHLNNAVIGENVSLSTDTHGGIYKATKKKLSLEFYSPEYHDMEISDTNYLSSKLPLDVSDELTKYSFTTHFKVFRTRLNTSEIESIRNKITSSHTIDSSHRYLIDLNLPSTSKRGRIRIKSFNNEDLTSYPIIIEYDHYLLTINESSLLFDFNKSTLLKGDLTSLNLRLGIGNDSNEDDEVIVGKITIYGENVDTTIWGFCFHPTLGICPTDSKGEIIVNGVIIPPDFEKYKEREYYTKIIEDVEIDGDHYVAFPRLYCKFYPNGVPGTSSNGLQVVMLSSRKVDDTWKVHPVFQRFGRQSEWLLIAKYPSKRNFSNVYSNSDNAKELYFTSVPNGEIENLSPNNANYSNALNKEWVYNLINVPILNRSIMVDRKNVDTLRSYDYFDNGFLIILTLGAFPCPDPIGKKRELDPTGESYYHLFGINDLLRPKMYTVLDGSWNTGNGQIKNPDSFPIFLTHDNLSPSQFILGASRIFIPFYYRNNPHAMSLPYCSGSLRTDLTKDNTCFIDRVMDYPCSIGIHDPNNLPNEKSNSNIMSIMLYPFSVGSDSINFNPWYNLNKFFIKSNRGLDTNGMNTWNLINQSSHGDSNKDPENRWYGPFSINTNGLDYYGNKVNGVKNVSVRFCTNRNNLESIGTKTLENKIKSYQPAMYISFNSIDSMRYPSLTEMVLESVDGSGVKDLYLTKIGTIATSSLFPRITMSFGKGYNFNGDTRIASRLSNSNLDLFMKKVYHSNNLAFMVTIQNTILTNERLLMGFLNINETQPAGVINGFYLSLLNEKIRLRCWNVSKELPEIRSLKLKMDTHIFVQFTDGNEKLPEVYLNGIKIPDSYFNFQFRDWLRLITSNNLAFESGIRHQSNINSYLHLNVRNMCIFNNYWFSPEEVMELARLDGCEYVGQMDVLNRNINDSNIANKY